MKRRQAWERWEKNANIFFTNEKLGKFKKFKCKYNTIHFSKDFDEKINLTNFLKKLENCEKINSIFFTNYTLDNYPLKNTYLHSWKMDMNLKLKKWEELRYLSKDTKIYLKIKF